MELNLKREVRKIMCSFQSLRYFKQRVGQEMILMQLSVCEALMHKDSRWNGHRFWFNDGKKM